ELFSPVIIGERVEGMLKGYPFVTAETLAYFAKRPPQAKKDSEFALDYVKRNARTPAEQRLVLDALEFKCGVLWSMLDVLHFAYVSPGYIPPGAFVPKESVSPDARPKLPRGVRLTHNEAQGGWVLLAPERVFKAEGPASEIVKRCTGEATVNEIVDDLAK